ncbi:DUF2711 family protein [Radiobacillus sp. PE A8.2]|uniref:DUF2711 family protein n=1 Tax=Radiobacillus sp. PE A8.2 TaxID=3380349 RepID=UPI00388E6388
MEYFYPIGNDPENEPLLELLPNGYMFASKIFYPFIMMPKLWHSSNSEIPHKYYPVKEDILKFGKPLTWEELRKSSGLRNIAEMSIAVTAALTGAEYCRKVYRRPDLSNKLENHLVENIYFPLEDQFSVLLMRDMLSVLASNGAKRIKFATISGEQGTYKISDINAEMIIKLCSEPITICDENKDFIFTCNFDEVAAVFSAKKDCRELLTRNHLEGIIFDEKTPLVWENYNYFLLK